MSDFKFWDVFRDPLWLLHNFMNKYKHIRVPTNASWTDSNVNGTVVQQPFRIYAFTTVAINSRGMGFTSIQGLNSGNIDSTLIDWTKQIELSFQIARVNADVEAVARIQLKGINTEGVLAAQGIGLQISNLTLVGEAYGTARQTTGTLKTLITNHLIRVKIVKTDTSVDFWVDGLLIESLTGTAVPSTAGITNGFLAISIINGATGGVDARIYVNNIEVVQAW